MMSGPATTLHAEYLRRVRRLRGQYSHRPGELHRRIKALSTEGTARGMATPASGLRRVVSREISTPREASARRGSPEAGRTPQEAFAERVARQIEAGVLRYSRRVELLEAAARMGLGRFEANLAIATVLHRMKGRPAEEEPRGGRGHWQWVALAAVQAGITGAGVWWFLL